MEISVCFNFQNSLVYQSNAIPTLCRCSQIHFRDDVKTKQLEILLKILLVCLHLCDLKIGPIHNV